MDRSGKHGGKSCCREESEMEGDQGGSRNTDRRIPPPGAKNWAEVEKQFERERRSNKTCSKCKSQFHAYSDFEKHIRNRKNILCTHCDKTFCTNHQIEKHLRTVNIAKDSPIDYEKCIHEKTGYEDDPRFEELVEAKWEHICDQITKYSNHQIINKKICPDFTYGDLDDLLSELYTKQTNSFKLNLGIGFILYNLKKDEYKYHYVSANNLLFKRLLR